MTEVEIISDVVTLSPELLICRSDLFVRQPTAKRATKIRTHKTTLCVMGLGTLRHCNAVCKLALLIQKQKGTG